MFGSMDEIAKVFSSNITRSENCNKNNLYELLNIVPAVPLESKETKTYSCNYNPKTDKYYVPKRKSKLKVKTVRDIRKTFEQDTYSYLLADLETQEKVLFRKIRLGSARNGDTITLAKKILRGDTPISRSTWQMLINLNPENHKHPRQYVLWDGKYIQVNGSFGGQKKNICNYDLARKKLTSQSNARKYFKTHAVNKKRGLLRNSLTVRFKPGPLCKKRLLDDSYQNNHIGNVDLIDVPKAGLDVQPTYGVALESTTIQFLNNLRQYDGTISRRWAEFAVSVLGTVKKASAVQLNKDCITFDLTYKYNQNKLLMRRDVNCFYNTSYLVQSGTKNLNTEPMTSESEIEDMINKMIDAVEINLIQDTLFAEESALTESVASGNMKSVDVVKDKTKRKFSELGRLDVTVITLPETEERDATKKCDKMYCSMGCICDSLESSYKHLKHHCGRIECMFDCKCDFSKYKNNLLNSDCLDIIPDLLNIDNEINLAKEEQKFHQTVIVTGEKRILLKGEKRNWKSSKKYADFYNNMSLKNEDQKKQDLSIVALKINCDNIEPWCMVHQLYKCFCKGKFIDSAFLANEIADKDPVPKDASNIDDSLEENAMASDDDSNFEKCVSTGLHLDRTNLVKKSKVSVDTDYIPVEIQKSTGFAKSKNINSGYESENEVEIHGLNIIQTTSIPNNEKKLEEHMVTRRSLRKSNLRNKQQNLSCNKNKNNKKRTYSESSDYNDYLNDASEATCSRTNAYRGRKYTDGYYKNTNYRISEMEKNDKRLQERLSLLNNTSSEQNTGMKPTARATTDATSLLELLCDNNNSSEENTALKPTATKTTDATSLLELLCDNNNSSDENTAMKSTATKTTDATSLLELLCDVNDIFPSSKNGDNDMMPTSKRKRLSNETKLVAWLVSNYKMYKQRNDLGLIKNSLEPPKLGKVALHSWDFILRRYRERKNLFLVTQQKPFRIFMAVNIRNPFFENCININDIRFADLNKYPQTVKNLLINATDLKDNFCILRGLSCCWELIGSVTKVSESDDHSPENMATTEINIDTTDMETSAALNPKNAPDNDVENHEKINIQTCCIPENQFQISNTSREDAGSSKWFVMTVENDFNEIRFFRKGFFVKYESIINAINVARVSGKTVRLSSKKCIEQCEIPQFGIYAIPNNNEYSVFVGPYELEDTLGIETIKTVLDVRRLKRTRGFWITTNKVDNLKVVENPLSFVPFINPQNNNAMPLETHFSENNNMNTVQLEKSDVPESTKSNSNETKESTSSIPPKNLMKNQPKPIKIRKTNGLYHIASDGVLKKLAIPYSRKVLKAVPVLKNTRLNTVLKPNAVSDNLNENSISDISHDPTTDAASQIKISAVFSTQDDDTKIKNAKPERGVFVILNPEEINRKLSKSQLTPESTSTPRDSFSDNDGSSNISLIELEQNSGTEFGTDLFSTTSSESGAPKDDVFVISDDENDELMSSEPTKTSCIWSDIWIECTNVSNIGWIAGIKNMNNLISFRFPGCLFSEFYTAECAFAKINSELFKRINNSMNLQLQWKITDSPDQVQGEEMNPEHLYHDYTLTQDGLLHASDITKKKKTNIKTYSNVKLKDKDVGSSSSGETNKVRSQQKTKKSSDVKEESQE